MPRHITTPLSGSSRAAQKDGLRRARALAVLNRERAAKLREEARQKVEHALGLECEAWSAQMWAGGPAEPSPTLADALSCGWVILRVQCGACHKIQTFDVRKLRRKPETPLWKLEVALTCLACRDALHYHPRAHIIGLDRPEPPQPQAMRLSVAK
jgi:hypothetical protein